MENRTSEPPFPNACRTGRMFISPYCTASVREFLAGSTLHLASYVAGRGWSATWPGRSERRIRWRADWEGR